MIEIELIILLNGTPLHDVELLKSSSFNLYCVTITIFELYSPFNTKKEKIRANTRHNP